MRQKSGEAEARIKVRFLRRYEVQDEKRGTSEATIYAEGETKLLPEASALHFMARGIAVEA